MKMYDSHYCTKMFQTLLSALDEERSNIEFIGGGILLSVHGNSIATIRSYPSKRKRIYMGDETLKQNETVLFELSNDNPNKLVFRIHDSSKNNFAVIFEAIISGSEVEQAILMIERLLLTEQLTK